jgi:hypothetical protein
MILDAENVFSLRQSLITGGAGNILSTYSVFLGTAGTLPVGLNSRGSAPHDVGAGQPIEVECKINTSVTGTAGTTIQAQLVMADDEGLTTNLVILAQTDAIAKATLVKGYRFAIASTLPPDRISKAYLGIRYVVAVSDVLTGAVTAALTFNKQTA